MRSAAGTAALPPALQPRTQKRRSDRRKKQDRRDKARKISAVGGTETTEFLAAAWMDALEDVATGGPAAEDDDSYDELDEMEDDQKKKRGKRGSSKKQPSGTLPKRFKPRSLANILLEEVNREDGVAHSWLATEARTVKSKIPARKFCPVTGMMGIYTEPKSGIPYSDLKALTQIRERAPPWMQLASSNAYHEATKSIRDET
jgi:hypothetical protein